MSYNFSFHSISKWGRRKLKNRKERYEPMYDSIKFKLVCVSSRAPMLFDAVQDDVTDPSHSADRIGLKKKQKVAIFYQLCYGLSQKCNWFECDHAVFLKDCHLNQQGLRGCPRKDR